MQARVEIKLQKNAKRKVKCEKRRKIFGTFKSF